MAFMAGMELYMKRTVCTVLALLLAGTVLLNAQSSDDMLIYSDDEYADKMASQSSSYDEGTSVVYSSSFINWTKTTFSSEVNLNLERAGIPMPSGKSSAVNKIQMELPSLIKDPLLSIYVDDMQSVGDLVLSHTFTLEQLSRIIANGKQTPAFFAANGNDLKISHIINIKDMGALLVKHHAPYTLRAPIEHIASRAYSGIVIDARGTLPVQGEFTSSKVYPCLFPKVYSEDMDLLYERNMVEPEIARTNNIVLYESSEKKENHFERAGRDPLWITAKKVYGVNRCDPVISHDDYLRITTVPENLELLREGKVILLLDKEQLEYAVTAPDKNRRYYLAYQNMKKYFIERKIPETIVIDAPTGIQISIRDLKFVADSSELLSDERERLSLIAESIKQITASNDFTILVEGHTADVNKPDGQLTLSIERAQTIINALVAEGVPRSLFTYKGYGGTMPVADNNTNEGRAQNRRVEITVMPKSSYIQGR